MEAKKGIDVILLYRILSKATEEAAWKMAFQTEHDNKMSIDTESTPTKDGPVQNPGELEYDFSATSILAKGDKRAKELKNAMKKREIIEIWEIDKAEKAPESDTENKGKYEGTYYQGYITSYGTKPNSQDSLELELEFAINGEGQDGYCTLTDEQATVVQYVFKDTVKEEGEG
ncbi:phage major tail protein, TP901-1 family [Enterococcus hulanensis]|uniref:phage major tail protein, TP901-1 family n=1 Tax=Enterococcus hulanensis TaxID=2559929 RepID=UPI001A8D77E6|nr:phage major tail protein, TP901-1 family [Enterococcus hulanensis]MBO0456285.1 phage major tail protein, TP901-1 family [Enterococcus hulanensis]